MFNFKSKYSGSFQGALNVAKYGNGRTAVQLLADGEYGIEPFATLSVNIPEVDLAEGEFVAKTYSENEGLVEQMVELGLMEKTGEYVPVGHAGLQPIMKLTEKAKEHLY